MICFGSFRATLARTSAFRSNRGKACPMLLATFAFCARSSGWIERRTSNSASRFRLVPSSVYLCRSQGGLLFASAFSCRLIRRVSFRSRELPREPSSLGFSADKELARDAPRLSGPAIGS
jgi:hypothetical protein